MNVVKINISMFDLTFTSVMEEDRKYNINILRIIVNPK